MKNTPQMLTFLATSFVLLTGFHGGCRQLTPEEKAARIERYSTAMVDDVMDDVSADLKQRAQAQAIRKRVVTAGVPLIAEQEKAKRFFYQQWSTDTPDRERIHRVVDERVDAFRKVLHLATDGLIELHDLLTPEQRQQVAERYQD